MKKFLSLVLALVMTMSLVTVSAGAKEFKDDDSITYDEAISVISTIGVVDGYEDGSFNPTGNLTRQAAAKIICNLKLGPTTASALVADAAPFPDVPVSSDFSGYIAYCAQNGIINGYSDGTFKPGNSLTGYAFMKMLLGALGYNSDIEGYTGDNWSVAVAKRAIGIGLNDGLEGEFNGVKTVNREEACLYAFNTLQADLVEYDTLVNTTINGQVTTIGSTGAKSRTWQSQMSRQNNIREDDIIQFAEEYFRKLEKKFGTDDFERPGYTWLYDKEEIGTYVDWSLQIGEDYLNKVTGRDLYDLIGVTYLREFDLTYYANGLVPGANNPTTTAKAPAKPGDASIEGGKNIIIAKDINRANEDGLGITGRGVLTQVFMDKDKKTITVTSISTWLAKATGDYNEKREDAAFDVYCNYRSTTYNKTATPEDCAAVADVTDGTFYLINISYKNNPGTAFSNGDIVAVVEPEILEESVVTKYSANNTGNQATSNKVTELTTGGNVYKANANLIYDTDILSKYDTELLTSNTYNVYLDQYGNFIGVDLFEGEKNYVFITGFDRPTSNLSISTADAAGIFLDGTMSKIKVNVTATNKNIEKVNPFYNGTGSGEFGSQYFWKWDSNLQVGTDHAGMYALNRWFTYSVDNSGNYTLKPAEKMAIHSYYEEQDVTIKTDNLFVDDNVMQKGSDKGLTGAYEALGGLFASGGLNYHEYYTGAQMAAKGWYVTAPSTLIERVRTYGNDDSVYMTVTTDKVDTQRDAERAITEVSGIYTGVQASTINVNTDTDAYLEEGQVYVVYDKNNYIIGAIVDGEGDGGSATVAYITKGPQSERYEDGVYYWEFEAVVDGGLQTLTARSTNRTDLDDIRNEAWGSFYEEWADIHTNRDSGSFSVPSKANFDYNYNAFDGLVELRFDSNDYVTSIKSIAEKDIYSYFGNALANKTARAFQGASSIANTADYTDPSYDNLDLAKAKAYRIGSIDADINVTNLWNFGGVNHHYDSSPNALKLVGRTLYVTYNQVDEGLALASDAKAVVIQWENGDWATTEYSSVKTAVNSIQMHGGSDWFDGQVVAALNSNGTASWIVIVNYDPVERSSSPIVNQRLTDVIAQGVRAYYDGSPTTETLGWYTAAPGTMYYALVNAETNAEYHVELQELNGGQWITVKDWTVVANAPADSYGNGKIAGSVDLYKRTNIGNSNADRSYRLVVGTLSDGVALN